MNRGRVEDLKDFYALLSALAERAGPARTLGACTGRSGWPKRGVYFFMELGEERSDSGTGPRIVRVGTHALKAGSGTALWTRLSQHRGRVSSGRGNHRGSIFRLIVGTAIAARDGQVHQTWGVGNNAPADIRAGEVELERRVSVVIGAMSVLWLGIDDEPGPESGRGYVERNAIALLSNFGKEPLDPPSIGWLGHSCNRERVKKSGLWNQNHVDEAYDPGFLRRFEALIDEAGAAQ